jgi:hypothetical protein
MRVFSDSPKCMHALMCNNGSEISSTQNIYNSSVITAKLILLVFPTLVKKKDETINFLED